MKKLLILLVLLSFKLTAQQNETRETVAKGRFYFIPVGSPISSNPKWFFRKVTIGNNSKNYFHISFKTKPYWGRDAITIYNDSTMRFFAEKLIEFGSMKGKGNQDIIFSQKEFNIKVYSRNKRIFIYPLHAERLEGDYIQISRKNAVKQGQKFLDFLALNPGFLTK